MSWQWQNIYRKAIDSNDKNIYIIDSDEVITDDIKDDCFVDGKHPNDLGMSLIANALIEKLNMILNR